MKKILKCNLILLLIISNFVYSQNFSKLGSPFIKNYSIKDYKANPQNWGVIQDERGVFYIGNTSGILEFDGIEFYVGGSGEIGYFAIDSIGKLKYVSLNRKLPRFERDFNDIYKVISTEKGVFFVSSYKIFHYFNDEIKIFATNSKANFAYDIYGDIFTINRYRGIFVIVDDNLALLPHSDIFSDHSGRIVMLPYGDKQILIATEKEGIYIYDLKRFYKEGIRQFNFYDKNIKKDILKKFPTEIDNFLEEHSLYCGEILDENTYAFGTLSNGIITMNKDGKFLQVINKKIGLASNTVLNLFKNKDKNLLVSLDRGFSIVEIKIPITLFSDLHGLDGSIYKAQKYKNNLYVGTSSGVYRLSKDTSSENKYISHFEKLKNVNTNCWDFIEFGNCLFGTQEKGVVCIEDSSVRLWHNLAEVIYCFGEKEMFPNHIFTGSADGLEAFEIKKNKFEKTKLINRYIFPEIRRTVRKIVG
ncbi:MAG: hypothetical protein B6I24_01500 [Bacteroidetes bacterium 4572_128]|nr:MAG: hypothetical protein B6I24_01500 [Bacteroidetes bacterium 4572_128]